MDRHDVSKDVTAEIVAELHQQDLKIQDKYNCKGLTYWFDDKRKTAFCLIEAPDKAALKQMHDQAHGEVPNKIIEVDSAVVESFLGRIEDPHKSQKKELNIINDPAFRTIMVVGIKPQSLKTSLQQKIYSVFAEHHSLIKEYINSFKGRLVKQDHDHFIVSFDSVTNAVTCALKLDSGFEKGPATKYDSIVKFQIGLNAGVPVGDKEGFFEDTIKAAHCFFGLVNGSVVVSSEVKELYESENMNAPICSDTLVALTRQEEIFLKELVNIIESEGSKTLLNADDFSRHFGYSRSRFYRKTVALTGRSINCYLKDYRLRKALNLLNKKDLNISEVAFETGFNSPAYFSKCFLETFGILPSQYIKSRPH